VCFCCGRRSHELCFYAIRP